MHTKVTKINIHSFGFHGRGLGGGENKNHKCNLFGYHGSV